MNIEIVKVLRDSVPFDPLGDISDLLLFVKLCWRLWLYADCQWLTRTTDDLENIFHSWGRHVTSHSSLTVHQYHLQLSSLLRSLWQENDQLLVSMTVAWWLIGRCLWLHYSSVST